MRFSNKLIFAISIIHALLILPVLAQNSCDSLLIAFYDFDENTNDKSGNDFHGQLHGSSTVTGVLEIPNDAASLMTLPSNTLNGIGDFSVICRIKFTHFQVTGADPINVILNGFSSNNALVIGYRKLANIVHITLNGVGTNIPLQQDLVEGQWYCFAFTRKLNYGGVYIDGVLSSVPINIGSAPVAVDSLLLGQDQDCLGGCFASNQSLAGELDNFRVFGRALSADEIAAFCGTRLDSITICDNQQYKGHATPGEYIEYANSEGNCEAMHILQLHVNPTFESTVQLVLCQGESFLGYNNSGNYEIRLQNQFGCDSVLHLNLQVAQAPYAPNEDGINDLFTIFGADGDFTILDFQIFDRWGELVFHQKQAKPNDFSYAWDGLFNGRPSTSGIYTWTAIIDFSCGKSVRMVSEVALIR